MRKSKISSRKEWILQNKAEIEKASQKYLCPKNCRSNCHNGRTCYCRSEGGWGWWVRAFLEADVECYPLNYWSGSAPTPSTSIDQGIAEYIMETVGIKFPQKEKK